LGYGQGDFPVTERYARRILSLPMFPDITSAAITHTVTAIASFYEGANGAL
jgi:dTDP-4-amino-4,6-dideoxygalactose transaminase